MPLLRYSLYSQNVNLYLAPTADARDTWLSLMRTVACEGRCFVLSANQCVRRKDLAHWLHDEVVEGDHPDKKDRKIRVSRRKPVVTESGHEIALAAANINDVEEEAIVGVEEEITTDEMHGGKSPILTKLGHQIILPVDGDKQNLQRAIKSDDDRAHNTGRVRRASIITGDGHEIVFPASGGEYNLDKVTSNTDEDINNKGHRRKASFITEGGHEIILPSDTNYSGFKKPINGYGPNKIISPEHNSTQSEFACRGGSCIISPLGGVLAGPSWEKENELLIAEVDFDDCPRGKLDLDVAGSYSRFVLFSWERFSIPNQVTETTRSN